MIPYQMITDFDSLEIKPEEEFFKHSDFYSCLKEKDISMDSTKMLKNSLNY